MLIVLQSVVHENYQKITVKDFVGNPAKYFQSMYKSNPALAILPIHEQPNSSRIIKHCIETGCYIFLLYDDRDLDFADILLPEDPAQFTDDSGSTIGWIIPAYTSRGTKAMAAKLGEVVWDERRNIIIYEAAEEELKEPDKLFVWQFTQDWSFGLLHWLELNLPASTLQLVGYDDQSGYMAFDHYKEGNAEPFRTSYYSVLDPVLITEKNR